MSTRCTILHGDKWHCYYECCDDDNIYIEIENPAEIEVRTWQGKTYASISIPGKILNEIIRHGELKSWGGESFDDPKSQEQRNQEFSDGIEETCAWMESLTKERLDEE